MKNFINVCDLDRSEIYQILDRADVLHEKWHSNQMPKTLQNQRVALWFYGQGFRNRCAFEIGARAMGADVTFIPGELGVQEPLEDVASYLNNWFTMIVLRCKNYPDLQHVVHDARVPVINARTSFNHPCEIMGDLQFIRRKRGSLEDLNVVFVGETTNLCMSWFEAAKALPIHVIQVAPAEYLAKPAVLDELNAKACGTIGVSENLQDTINRSTDVIYTDCWPKDDPAAVKAAFLPYQVNRQVVNRMNPKGFYLPCPPITRGQEISEDSLATEQYCDYQAKEFLLHAQNALMEYCIKADGASTRAHRAGFW